MILTSFIFFLLVFVAIGVLSIFSAKKTSKDYLLAGQNTKPWLAALSAIATNNSGYMFVGQIGFTYAFGLHSIWLGIGWIAGDFLTSLFVHKRLRQQSEKNKSFSFAGTLAQWQGTDFKYVRVIGGLITLAFLGTYAAAQLNAGSKALHVLFDWDYSIGAIIGAIIVLTYCFAGGIRASIWTDAAQSFVMIFAMALLLIIAVMEIGGLSAFGSGLYDVSDIYMNLFPTDQPGGAYLGPLLFVAGWFFAGVGVIGQPHIMVRFMAMDDADQMRRARVYYYGWYILFYAMTIAVALAARLLLPDTNGFDAELALPTLAGQLLPEIFVGLILAALFAATTSTADSQILSCTSSITQDLLPSRFSGYLANKISTLLVTAIALAIALLGSESVFSLVIIAWSALGSAFAPLLILFALRQPVRESVAILMMTGGLATTILWRFAGLNEYMYEIAPGILAGFFIYLLAKLFRLNTITPSSVSAS